jgi:hypothetical protein
MKRIGATLVALAIGLGAGLAAAAPASAGPAAAGTSLLVVIGPPQGSGPSNRTEPITAWLRCDPWAFNQHPFPVQACAEVINAKGDIASIPPLPGYACLAVYQPVTISVTGHVEGVPVSFSDVESNEGCASISHGHVFRLL